MVTMDERTNNEVFKEATARILSHLWEHSPVPTPLTSDTIPKLFHGLPPNELKVYATTVAWLEEEGYIRTKMVELQFPGGFKGVKRTGDSVLTEKGFTFLETPSVQDGGKSLGQKVFESLRNGAKDIAAKAIAEAMLRVVNGGL